MLTGMRPTEPTDEQREHLERLLPLGGYEEDLELRTQDPERYPYLRQIDEALLHSTCVLVQGDIELGKEHGSCPYILDTHATGLVSVCSPEKL